MFGLVLKVLLVNVYEKITQCILVSVFFVSFEGRFSNGGCVGVKKKKVKCFQYMLLQKNMCSSATFLSLMSLKMAQG